MKRILVVAPEFPFPALHGGQDDVLKGLIRLSKDFIVDLLYTEPTKVDYDRELELSQALSGDIFFARRDKSILSLLNIKPFQVFSRRALERVCINQSYDAVLLYSEYVSSILGNRAIDWSDTKKILRVHNDEPIYHRELAKTLSGVRKWYLTIESIKLRLYLKQLRTSFDDLWFISNEEMSSTLYEGRKHWVPPAVDFSNSVDFSECDSKSVLFVGSLFMPNNKEGLIWYLDNVHPDLIKSVDGYSLVVAGNPRDEDISWLYRYPSVDIHVKPSDEKLQKLYQESVVFISPMFHGAGVKLKTVNAIVNGLAVVGTSIGCEGVGLKNKIHAYITDESKEFYQAVALILNNDSVRKAVSSKAVEHIFENFKIDFCKLLEEK